LKLVGKENKRKENMRLRYERNKGMKKIKKMG
jgi:hypothetical protein